MCHLCENDSISDHAVLAAYSRVIVEILEKLIVLEPENPEYKERKKEQEGVQEEIETKVLEKFDAKEWEESTASMEKVAKGTHLMDVLETKEQLLRAEKGIIEAFVNEFKAQQLVFIMKKLLDQ